MVKPNEKVWIVYAISALLGESVSPPSLPLPIEQLEQSRLMPLVDWALCTHRIDIAQGEYKPGKYSFSKLHNELKLYELGCISTLFQSEEIELRALKGIAACLHLYEHKTAVRPMADIDILVKSDDFQNSINALLSLGYELKSDQISVDSSSVNQVSLVKNIGQLHCWIDLHRLFHNWPILHALPARCFEKEFSNTIHGIPVISKELAFVWEIGHRAKDFYLGDSRGLVDLRMYMHSMSDSEWERTIQILNELDLVRHTVITLRQIQLVLGDMHKRISIREHQVLNLVHPVTLDLLTVQANRSTNRNAPHWLPRTAQMYFGFWPSPKILGQAFVAMTSYGLFKCRAFLRKERS